MKLKPGVRLTDLSPQMVLAAIVVNDLYKKRGLECVVTSANDSKHMVNSKHYKGNALDFRTHYRELNNLEIGLRDEIRECLGSEYVVLLEGVGTPNEHMHIQYNGDGVGDA